MPGLRWRFRLDLNVDRKFLQEAEATLTTLRHGRGKAAEETGGSPLGAALRSALSLDPKSVVPACQLLALLDAKGQSEAVLSDAQLHLGWLTAIMGLVEGQSEKPSDVDLCWLAAFGGDRHSDDLVRKAAVQQQTAALESLLAAFNVAYPPPASLGGRPDRPSTPTDTAMLRFRAAWDTFFHRALDLCGSPSSPFALISQEQATRLLLSQTSAQAM